MNFYVHFMVYRFVVSANSLNYIAVVKCISSPTHYIAVVIAHCSLLPRVFFYLVTMCNFYLWNSIFKTVPSNV